MTRAPKWLDWAQRLQAIAQSGLAYTENPFEVERYEQVRDIAAQMMAAHSDIGAEQVATLYRSESGYATPKVDVRGAVFDQDRILLVKELRDGRWTLPGGWADVGDSPAQAVEREILEESGYRARAVKLVACWDRNKHGHPAYVYHLYKLFFECELLGGEATESIETAGARFYREDEIPPLSLPRVTPTQIARLFEHHRHPEWPTDFD